VALDPRILCPLLVPAADEWQTVEEGQAIPPGLHVQVNLGSGRREAKKLDKPIGTVCMSRAGYMYDLTMYMALAQYTVVSPITITTANIAPALPQVFKLFLRSVKRSWKS